MDWDAGRDYCLLISCLSDGEIEGGLFAFGRDGLERLDPVSTTGLCCAPGRLVRMLRSAAEPDASGEIVIYDARGVVVYLRIDGLSDPHDVMWDGQHLVAVSSATNSVLWIAPSGAIERVWRAPGEPDSWHLNSLLLHRGKLLVTAFGRFENGRGWAEVPELDAGIVFELEGGRTVLKGLALPHHPRFFDGVWTICNSRRAEIAQIDPSSGATIRTIKLDGFTRGVAVTDELILVGESVHRLNRGSAQRARIAVISRREWKLLDRIELPVREIYDIVVAPLALAVGARRGFDTNQLRVGEGFMLGLHAPGDSRQNRG